MSGTDQAQTPVPGPQRNADSLTVPPQGIEAEESQNALEGAPGGEPKPPANREARYRVERNEARAERDSLTETLTQLQTKELHRLAGEHLADPADIDLAGYELNHYLTPEGWVDHDAVAEAAASVVASRPGVAKNAPAYDPTQGHGSRVPKAQPSFAALLKS